MPALDVNCGKFGIESLATATVFYRSYCSSNSSSCCSSCSC